MRVKIYKCYEVVIEDKDGNTLASDYCYGNREEAERDGRMLKRITKQRMEEEQA